MSQPKPLANAPAEMQELTTSEPDQAGAEVDARAGENAADTQDGGALLLELVEQAAERRHQQTPPPPPDGVVLGVLVAMDAAGQPLVRYGDGPTVPALTTVTLNQDQVGRLVAMAFDKSANPRPIVLGVVHNPEALLNARASAVEASRDGQRVELSADKEIVLRCGKASITLTRAGKILLKGTYVLSRSSGVNRIRGGSVQIN